MHHDVSCIFSQWKPKMDGRKMWIPSVAPGSPNRGGFAKGFDKAAERSGLDVAM